MRVASFDPGGTTGIAWHNHDNLDAGPSLDQLGPHEHHLELQGYLDAYRPDVVVCESFLYRQQDNAVLISCEYIGIIKLWCLKNGVELVMQTPSTGKAFWTDDKLKAIGLYTKGAPHARDGLRHLLHYYTFKLGDNYYINKLKP